MPTRMFRWENLFKSIVTAAKLPAFLGAIAVGAAAMPSNATAADPFEELRQRIEQLEQDNRDLRARVAPAPIAFDSIASAVPPAPEEAPAELTEEEQRIGSIVEKYLQRRPAQADLQDSAQDQNISTLQGSVAGILDRLNKKTLPNVTVLGVFQSDVGFITQDPHSVASYGRIQNGADFRRARLAAKAAITDTTNGFFQMDFAFFGRPTFTDVWVEQTQIPGIGTWRIGQWKQPFSLEVVSSFRYTTFVERSVLFQAFTPFRHLGTGIYNNSEDLSMTWAASVFASGQDQFGGSIGNSGGWATAERVTYCPIWDEESKGREYLHLGLGHFFSAPPNKSTIFRTIPELYIGNEANSPTVGTSGQQNSGAFNGIPFFVNTGQLGVNNFNVLGTEVLFVEGPFSFQSEAMVTLVNQASNVGGTQNTAGGPMATFEGLYATVGYFLTGEHRPYDRKSGTIERVVPFHNFAPWKDECGWGAWEVASRFSHIDLNSENIRGGRMNDYTAGLNWYLTPYWKIQLNYIYSASNFSYNTGIGPGGSSNTPAGVFFGNHTSLYDLRCQMDF